MPDNAQRWALAIASAVLACSQGEDRDPRFGSPALGEAATSETGQGDTDDAPLPPDGTTSGVDFDPGEDIETGTTGEPATDSTGADPADDPLAPFIEYTFDEGAGATIGDSGSGPGYDLTIQAPSAVTWLASGLRVDAPTRASTNGGAAALVNACKASNEFTVEAWVQPATIDQTGPARIVSLSSRSQNRNFTLGQGLVNETDVGYLARVRTPATDDNGLLPEHVDPIRAPSNLTSTARTHVVLVRHDDGNTRLYLDGALVTTAALPGSLDGWNTLYQLSLANEHGRDRPWRGTYDYVALYARALDAGEISEKYTAGPD